MPNQKAVVDKSQRLLIFPSGKLMTALHGYALVEKHKIARRQIGNFCGVTSERFSIMIPHANFRDPRPRARLTLPCVCLQYLPHARAGFRAQTRVQRHRGRHATAIRPDIRALLARQNLRNRTTHGGHRTSSDDDNCPAISNAKSPFFLTCDSWLHFSGKLRLMSPVYVSNSTV